MSNIFLIFLLFSSIPLISPYNFLVFCPVFGHSHSTFFGKIADILTDAGHNVTFFSPIIARKYANVNYTQSTKTVVYLEPSKKLASIGDAFDDADFSRYWTDDFTLLELYQMGKHFDEMYKEQVNVLRNNLELLDNLKAQKFDVMIFEPFVHCAYPLLDYLEIKTHLPAASMTYDARFASAIGEPTTPSYIPLPMSQYSDKMNFLERLFNTIAPPIFDFFLPEPEFLSFRQPHRSLSIPEIEAAAPFAFTNANPFIEFPKAIITKHIQIGGVSVDMEKLKSEKVDEKWDKILGKREKTVLISFGSVMLSKDMPIGYKTAIAGALRKFPNVTFIWKYEDESTNQFAKGLENVHFAKWIPQTALLADPRLSAFMTHGGLGSVNEVSYLGKPTVLCPIFADQMRNAKMLARHNGTIEIHKHELADSQKIESVLRTILYDDSYRKNSESLALQLEKQPGKPRELVLKYSEFAAQFGRLPSLDPHSRTMPFYQYYLLDVIAVLAGVGGLMVIVTWKIVGFAWRIVVSCWTVKKTRKMKSN